MSELDPAARHAVAQLDMAARVLPGLLATLDAKAAYARLLRDAAAFADPGSFPLRADGHYRPSAGEQELARGRLALLKAAKCTRQAWAAMPDGSPERAAVLLRGASVLGIVTDWNPVLPGDG